MRSEGIRNLSILLASSALGAGIILGIPTAHASSEVTHTRTIGGLSNIDNPCTAEIESYTGSGRLKITTIDGVVMAINAGNIRMIDTISGREAKIEERYTPNGDFTQTIKDPAGRFRIWGTWVDDGGIIHNVEGTECRS